MQTVFLASAPAPRNAVRPTAVRATTLGTQAAVAKRVHGWHAMVADPIGNLLRLLVVWQTRAETRRQLASLDARLWRDMGLREDQVRQEVSKPFWMP